MKTDAWMPLWIGDYLADTLHLTTEQHGAYLLLIMGYWRRRGPLPDDDAYLAAVAKAMPSHWQTLRPVLAPFFEIAAGVWRHKRIEAELQAATQRQTTRSAAGAAGAAARWNGKRIAGALPTQRQTDPLHHHHHHHLGVQSTGDSPNPHLPHAPSV